MTKQEEILEWINKYLTEQFIGDPSDLPEDECRKEASVILSHIVSEGGVIPEEGERGTIIGKPRKRPDLIISDD